MTCRRESLPRSMVIVGCGSAAALLALVSLVAVASIQQVKQHLRVRPTQIDIDASESRERALMSVDASIEGAHDVAHGITIDVGSTCELLAGKTRILLARLNDFQHVGPEKVRMGVELDHGSVADVHLALQNGPAPKLICQLGIKINMYQLGLMLPYRFSTGNLLGQQDGMGGTQAALRIVNMPAEIAWPARAVGEAHAKVTHRLQAEVPSSMAPELARFLDETPIKVKAGIKYADGDINAFYIAADINSVVKHWTKGEGSSAAVVLELPVNLVGCAHMQDTAAVLSGALTRTHARRMTETGGYYYLAADETSARPTHSLLVQAAAPNSAMAVALGASHTVSLQRDAGTPRSEDLAEVLLKAGRQLRELPRALSEGTLQGLAFSMHTRILLDNAVVARLDVDAAGGNPALTFTLGLVLNTFSNSDSGFVWSQSRDAFGIQWSTTLEQGKPATVGSFAFTSVRGWAGGKIDWANALWYYENSSDVARVSWNADVSQQSLTFSFELLETKKSLFRNYNFQQGEANRNFSGVSWFTENPVVSGLTPAARRLTGVFGKAWDAAVSARGGKGPLVRRLGNSSTPSSVKTEASSSSTSITLSVDLDGIPASPNKGSFVFSLQAAGATIAVSATKTESSAEVQEYKLSLTATTDPQRDPADVANPRSALASNSTGQLTLHSVSTASVSLVLDNTSATQFATRGNASAGITCKATQDATYAAFVNYLPPTFASSPMCLDGNSSSSCCLSGITYALYSMIASIAGMDLEFNRVYSLNAWDVKLDKPMDVFNLNPIGYIGSDPEQFNVNFTTVNSNGGSTWTAIAMMDRTQKLAQLTGTNADNAQGGMSATLVLWVNISQSDSKANNVATLNLDTFNKDAGKNAGVTLNATSGLIPDKIDAEWLGTIAAADVGNMGFKGRARVFLNKSVLATTDATLDSRQAFYGTSGWNVVTRVLDNSSKEVFGLSSLLDTRSIYGELGFKSSTTVKMDGNEAFAEETVVNTSVPNVSAVTQVVQTQGAGLYGAMLNLKSSQDAVRLTADVKDGNKQPYAGLAFSSESAGGTQLKQSGSLVVNKSTVAAYGLNIASVGDTLTLDSTVDGPDGRLGLLTSTLTQSSTNGLDTYSSTMKLLNGTGVSVADFKGTFAADGQKGVLSAALNADGIGNMMSLNGNMVKSGRFFVGPLQATFLGLGSSQSLTANASDGWVSTVKNGRDDYKRFYLGVSDIVIGTIKIAGSGFLEIEPFNGGLSANGLTFSARDVGSGADLVNNTMAMAYPHDLFIHGLVTLPPVEPGATRPPPQVSTMKAEMLLNKAASFDRNAFAVELSKVAGVPLEDVKITKIEFVVQVGYTFTAPVTEAQAKAAIAAVQSVSPDKVQVTIKPATRRRLAGGSIVSAKISTENATQAQTVQTAVTNTASLITKLQEQGVTGATVTVSDPPKVAVVLETQVTSRTGKPAVIPPQDQLQRIATASGASSLSVIPMASTTTTTGVPRGSVSAGLVAVPSPLLGLLFVAPLLAAAAACAA